MTALIDSRVLVHIGLHKTASSWMQEHLFSRPELGFYGPAENEERLAHRVKGLGHKLVVDDLGKLLNEWDFDAEAVRASWARLQVKDGVCPVVSYERLGGHPLSNGFDRAVLSRRIKGVLPKACILICIREQVAIVLSNYMQYLRNGGWNTPEGFLNLSDGRQPTPSLKFWEYHRLISMYYEIFGKGAVLILPYEMFCSQPLEFVGRICAFVGVPPPAELPVRQFVNTRRGHFSSYYSRFLTPLRKSSSANGYFPSSRTGKKVDKLVKGLLDYSVPNSWEERTREKLQQRVARFIGDHYCASNRASQELTGLNLAEYGYRMISISD